MRHQALAAALLLSTAAANAEPASPQDSCFIHNPAAAVLRAGPSGPHPRCAGFTGESSRLSRADEMVGGPNHRRFPAPTNEPSLRP